MQLAATHFIGFLTSRRGCDPPFTPPIKIAALLPAGNIGTLGLLGWWSDHNTGGRSWR